MVAIVLFQDIVSRLMLCLLEKCKTLPLVVNIFVLVAWTMEEIWYSRPSEWVSPRREY